MTARTGRFSRADRLLRSREFHHVTRQGRRAASSAYVVLVASDGGEGRSRLGVTVSRKVGNAVVRNRVKRCIRAWFRRERHRWSQALQVVVIARREAATLDAAETGRMLSALVARAAQAAQ